MKIEHQSLNPLQTNRAESAQQADKQRSVEKSNVEPQRDRAELSEKAKLLAKARAELDKTSAEDTKKVEDLKEQIQQGKYEIPYDQLAKKMLGNIDLKG